MALLKLSPIRSQEVAGCQGQIFTAAVPLTGRAKSGACQGCSWGCETVSQRSFQPLNTVNRHVGGHLVMQNLSLEGREVGLVRVAHGAVGGRVSVTGSIGEVGWNWVAGQRQALAAKPAARHSNAHCRALTQQKGVSSGLEAVQSGAEAWPPHLHVDATAQAS